MDYREYPPCERTAGVLACVWTLEGHARELGGEPQPVLPDGRAEIVVHFGDRFERLHDGGVERQAELILAGQLTGQLMLAPTGRVAVLGIRFRPEGLTALLRHAMYALTGVVTDLRTIDRRAHDALLRIRESATSLADAARRARGWVAAEADGSRIDTRVARAVAAIERRGGQGSIDAVLRESGTSPRQLERLFDEGIGLSPKRLARITRFQRALAALEHAERRGAGATTALACGYADQAHFIRDFKALAGCPPGAHLVRRTELTGFFVSGRPPAERR
jgi:AraC-like DNA-binding protein